MTQPNVASKRGCILSANLPASGAMIAIETAWSNTIFPACAGLNPLMYCKYKLNKKASEKLLAYIKNDVDKDRLNTRLSKNICTLMSGRRLRLWWTINNIKKVIESNVKSQPDMLGKSLNPNTKHSAKSEKITVPHQSNGDFWSFFHSPCKNNLMVMSSISTSGICE